MNASKEACRLSIGSCMETALSQGRLRVLIVGCGIAGATLAALLYQRGINSVVTEQGDENEASGYVLGLYPLGSRVLYGLNMHLRYRQISSKMERYVLYDHSGKVLKEIPLDTLADSYGDIRGVDRGDLLALLRSGFPRGNVFYNTSIQHIQNNDQNVIVTFSDGSAQAFDLVVGADGGHSHVREMILSQNEYTYRPTGWGGWGVWRSLEGFDNATYRELWADGWFVGIYPVQNRLAVYMGGSKDMVSSVTATQFAKLLQSKLPAGVMKTALQSLEGLENPYFWNMEDCRASRWSAKRVVLLGDAATSFLPTAGIGSSISMDSASVLAEELTRTDALHVSHAISNYIARQKKHVETAQRKSRIFATVMLKNSLLAIKLRNAIIKKCSTSSFLKGVSKIMR
ncbi:NAD(P)/FAD-dependent oxidoreductase [Halodesulfovibrio sp.]|jgi:2-polyprenyl-6-methoxyphenol hydroxylase-like FAD-dependent oxidoreductase|uniref:FAD-dependent oxidoreductase n=1 Tax=Halodesulfovibrio sp. TaxID=1912772 RepID=UPI0025FD1671|nr:NAD(P)/FAD-dependent oxidoreductase [Halodesulfovibrio sp.]MCT4625799.1 FAD-dependent monooxygenase [Halodesulfovibrio sp.]